MQPMIYDIEIEKAIPSKNPADILQDIDYCAGWHDYTNMGISVICAYDYLTERFRVFCKDNIAEFFKLAPERLMVGFNSIPFDDAVICATYGEIYQPVASYDILREIWKASGLGPTFKYPSHIGYSLDAVASANLFQEKTGNGALAPVQWQRGEVGSVIDYCLQDVNITKLIFDRICNGQKIICPKTGELLTLSEPQLF